jgi:ABC-type branched-subunit amino acid transport system ATPase component
VTGLESDNAFKVTPAGTVTQLIGPTGDGVGNVLNQPGGVALDAQGRIYVSGKNNAFRIVLP